MASSTRAPSIMLLRSLRQALQTPRHALSKQYIRTAASYVSQRHAQAISILPTLVDKSSAEYKQNAEDLGQVVAKYKELHDKISQGGPEKNRQKHIGRGKMLARDRVTALIDPGAPFLELSPLAAHEVYDEDVPAAGVVAGIGSVEGVTCVIVANDATVIDHKTSLHRPWLSKRPL